MSRIWRLRCWRISATRSWTFTLSRQQRPSWHLHPHHLEKDRLSHFQPLTLQPHHKQATQHLHNLLCHLASHHHLSLHCHLLNQLPQHPEVHQQPLPTLVTLPANQLQLLTTHSPPWPHILDTQATLYLPMVHHQSLPHLPVTLQAPTRQHITHLSQGQLPMDTLKHLLTRAWLTHHQHRQ